MERINQNQCPLCGRYDWAHPFSDCLLSIEDVKKEYEAKMVENRIKCKS